MIAAPRLATVGMKSFSIQAWSSTDLGGVAAADLGVEQVGVLGRGVVAPDRHVPDVGDGGARPGGQLRDRPVVVEPGQRREPLGRDVGGVGHRDQRVGVGRVARDPDAYVVRGDVVERLALRGEDRAVGLEQVAALHAGTARPGADQQREVDAVEDLGRVRPDLDARQRRERAVVELHDDALERLQGGLDLQQPQLHGAVAQGAAREAEQQAVADLAGGTGDGHLEGRGEVTTYSLVRVRVGRDGTASDASSGATCCAHAPMSRAGPCRPCASLAVAASLGLAGCGGCGDPPTVSPDRASTCSRSRRPSPDPEDFVERVDNPWLPLLPGAEWSLRVPREGTRRSRSPSPTDPGGRRRHRHRRPRRRHRRGREVVEETDDWYAQDTRRQRLVLRRGHRRVRRAGPSTGHLGVVGGRRRRRRGRDRDAGRPRRGDGYAQEHAEGEAEDRATMLAIDASSTWGATPATGLLVTEETTPLEPGLVEQKYYARGTGAGLRGDGRGGHGGGGAGRVHPR